MARLNEREKRFIQIAAIGISIYLVLFYGVRWIGHLEDDRREYVQLLQQARDFQLKEQRYENKMLRLEKLRGRINPANLSKANLVGLVSAAIQQAAKTGRVKLGPIREIAGSASSKQLVAMQLEAMGPVDGAMSLLHRLDNLGYPLVVDTLQIDRDQRKPGQLKLNLRVLVLDYRQWAVEEDGDA